MIEKKNMLTVCVVTYNQCNYIAQCLQSIVDQVTNFEFEIIVGDDCSTDGTTEIVLNYAEKYPNLIKPLIYKSNVGAAQNFLNVHKSAQGKYVAHIDGDDYMLPNKLQCQVDFMDANPACNLSWHRVLVEYNGNIKPDLFDVSCIPIEGFKRADILKFITLGMNSSKMYRSESFNFTNPSFPVLDYFANVEQIGEGYANFVSNVPLGVYRAGIGIANNDFKVKDALNKSFLFFIKKYPESRHYVNQAILLLILLAIKNRKFKEFGLFFKAYLLSFSLATPLNLAKDYKFIKTLRLPK